MESSPSTSVFDRLYRTETVSSRQKKELARQNAAFANRQSATDNHDFNRPPFRNNNRYTATSPSCKNRFNTSESFRLMKKSMAGSSSNAASNSRPGATTSPTRFKSPTKQTSFKSPTKRLATPKRSPFSSPAPKSSPQPSPPPATPPPLASTQDAAEVLTTTATTVVLWSTKDDPEALVPLTSLTGIEEDLADYELGILPARILAVTIIDALFHREFTGEAPKWDIDEGTAEKFTTEDDDDSVVVFDVNKKANYGGDNVYSVASSKARIYFEGEDEDAVIRIEGYSYVTG